MTLRDLAAVGVRLLAIYALLLGVNSLVFPLANLALSVGGGRTQMSKALTGSDWLLLLVASMPFLMLSLLAAFLWFVADPLAYFVVGREREQPLPPTSLSRHDLLVLALFVMGVYMVVSGVPDLVSQIGNFIYIRLQAATLADVLPRFIVAIFSESVRIALGLLLIAKSRHIAAGLFKSPLQAVREAGRDPEQHDAPNGSGYTSAP